MKRRQFLELGIVTATAATVGALPASAQAKMVLRATDVHPLGYPTVEAVVRMGKKLEAATNGRLSIQMFPSMQLGGEKEMIEQAQVGALQIRPRQRSARSARWFPTISTSSTCLSCSATSRICEKVD